MESPLTNALPLDARKVMADFGINWTFVEITNRCNMRCRFCPSESLRRPRQDMAFGLFQRVIDELAELTPPHPIALHMLGEPLLRQDLPDILGYCRQRGLRLYLFTNGLLLNRKIQEICRWDHIDALVISVQTPTPESFALRGLRMPFEKYMASIRQAIEYIVKTGANEKIRVEIHLANTKGMAFRDWDCLASHEDARRVFRELGRDLKVIDRRFRGEPCDPATLERLLDEDFKLIPQAILDTREWNYWGYEAIPNCFIRLKYFGNFGGSPSILPQRFMSVEKTEPAQCVMAKENLCVLADGTITACCTDTEGETKIGHMDQGGIDAALRSERRRQLIDNVGICRACRICLGEIADVTMPYNTMFYKMKRFARERIFHKMKRFARERIRKLF
jgi:organic radical activating enzyme